MIPCDVHWRPITHSDGEVLSYVEIASLYQYAIFRVVRHGLIDTISGRHGHLIRNLSSMMNQTDFWNIHNISRSQILDMGNHRQCLSRRAEATMSVIGATDWYDENAPHPPIMGATAKYPLAYLKEIRSLIGSAIFFGSMPSAEFSYSFITMKWNPKIIGSLMPIGKHVVVREGMMTLMKEHSSLKTWKIDSEFNTVKILEAGVIKTNTPKGDATYIYGLSDEFNEYVGGQRVSLHRWIEKQNENLARMTCYPVALAEFRAQRGRNFVHMVSGIILAELPPQATLRAYSAGDISTRVFSSSILYRTAQFDLFSKTEVEIEHEKELRWRVI